MRTLVEIVEEMSYVPENDVAEAKAFRKLYNELQHFVTRKTNVVLLKRRER